MQICKLQSTILCFIKATTVDDCGNYETKRQASQRVVFVRALDIEQIVYIFIETKWMRLRWAVVKIITSNIAT